MKLKVIWNQWIDRVLASWTKSKRYAVTKIRDESGYIISNSVE